MDASFYPFAGAMAWIGLLLMVGVFLRARVRIFQKLMFPPSLIGGLVGFVLMQCGLIGMPTAEGWKAISPSVFSMMTFHLFAFNFIGIGLIKSDSPIKSKLLFKGAIWIALMLNVCYAAQCLVGYGVFAGWDMLTGSEGSSLLGILVGTGFTQGPGQAQAYGTIWETGYNVANAVNVGFTFAAIGFLVAGVVGVPLANYLIKCGFTSSKQCVELSQDFVTGVLSQKSREIASYETLSSSSMSTLGYHLGVMFFLYGVAYLIALAQLLYTPKAVASLAFGLLFMIALIVSMLFRKSVAVLKVDYIFDNGTIKSITSAIVDLLICAVFMGINASSLAGYGIPILIAVLLATALTVFICMYFGSKLSEYGMERAMATFGYATGTGANALMLLRVVDGHFSTPIATEMGLVIVFQLIIILPFTVCIPLAPVLGMTLTWILAAVLVASILGVYCTKFLKSSPEQSSPE